MIEKIDIKSYQLTSNSSSRMSLFDLWGHFLKIGSTAFGGFMALVTQMSKKAIKGWQEISIAAVAAILLQTIGGFYITLIVILGAGLIGCFYRLCCQRFCWRIGGDRGNIFPTRIVNGNVISSVRPN